MFPLFGWQLVYDFLTKPILQLHREQSDEITIKVIVALYVAVANKNTSRFYLRSDNEVYHSDEQSEWPYFVACSTIRIVNFE